MSTRATGKPSLKRHRASKPAEGALALEEALKERMPERTLLEILARTAYWLEWWRRFGPASGSDPKLAAPLLRYVLTTFTYGANLGPAQAARHIRGVSAHELTPEASRGASAHRRAGVHAPRLLYVADHRRLRSPGMGDDSTR